jgi:hypothetical protein
MRLRLENRGSGHKTWFRQTRQRGFSECRRFFDGPSSFRKGATPNADATYCVASVRHSVKETDRSDPVLAGPSVLFVVVTVRSFYYLRRCRLLQPGPDPQ